MKKSILTSVLSLVCFIITTGTLSAEVTIIGIEIPGLHQKDGQGTYDKIIHEAAVKTELAKFELYSPARAEKKFADCTNCAFSPANLNPDFYDYKNVEQTDPMNIAKVYIFTNQGTSTINNLGALKNKKVGIRIGMPYGKSFDNAKLKTDSVAKISLNISKLQKGRIDAFIAYVPDAYNAFRSMGIEPFPHDVANPIAIHPDSLVCRKVPSDFIKKFNMELKKMKDSGRLKEILGDDYSAE